MCIVIVLLQIVEFLHSKNVTIFHTVICSYSLENLLSHHRVNLYFAYRMCLSFVEDISAGGLRVAASSFARR